MAVIHAATAVSGEEPKRSASWRLPQVCLSIVYYMYFYSFCFFGCLPVGLASLLSRFTQFDKQKRIAHWLTRGVGYHLIRLNPFWKIEFENLDYLEPGRTYVIVANHQSLCDVLALCGLPHFYKWIAKEQIFAMPAVGTLLRLNSSVRVAPGTVSSVRKMMRDARRYLKSGVSIFIFPEGARTEDGNLLPFKEGPFRLAVESETPVLPIVLDGTRDILPRGAWIIDFRARVRVKLLKPIEVDRKSTNISQLCNDVRRLIEDELNSQK